MYSMHASAVEMLVQFYAISLTWPFRHVRRSKSPTRVLWLSDV